jgi:Flp pilus assembly pilin Flp
VALIVIAMFSGLSSLGGGVGGKWSSISNATNTYMP